MTDPAGAAQRRRAYLDADGHRTGDDPAYPAPGCGPDTTLSAVTTQPTCPACRKPLLPSQHTSKSQKGNTLHRECFPAQSRRGKTKPRTGSVVRIYVQFEGSTPAAGPGVCTLCGKSYKAGMPMSEVNGDAVHYRCANPLPKPEKPARRARTGVAEYEKNKARIEEGLTFRGHKPSGWRLGASPSSSDNSRA